MTVAELIEKLKDLPQGYMVISDCCLVPISGDFKVNSKDKEVYIS